MRILCPECQGGGDVAHDYGVRMSTGAVGTSTVVGSCRNCKGTGRVSHPGKWKPVTGQKPGTDAS